MSEINDNDLIKKEIEARRVFLFTLEWLLALLNRYSSSIQFDLVHIELGSNHELGEAFGVQEAFKQMALLTTALNKDFRKTDIITRNVTDYWIIIPYDSNREQIKTKIIDIFNSAAHQNLNIINREIAIFSLPLAASESITSLTTATELLEHLKEYKQTLATHIFTLAAHE